MISTALVWLVAASPALATEYAAPDDVVAFDLQMPARSLPGEPMPVLASRVVGDLVVGAAFWAEADAAASLQAEFSSSASWDDEDGRPGRLSLAYAVVDDSGRVAIDATIRLSALLEVFEDDGLGGRLIASVPLKTGPVDVRLVSEPFTPPVRSADAWVTLVTNAPSAVDVPFEIAPEVAHLYRFEVDPPRWRGRPGIALRLHAGDVLRNVGDAFVGPTGNVGPRGAFDLDEPVPDVAVQHDWPLIGTWDVAAEVTAGVAGVLVADEGWSVPIDYAANEIHIRPQTIDVLFTRDPGVAVHPLAAAVLPERVHLGEQRVGEAREHLVTIDNEGDAPLEVEAWVEGIPGVTVVSVSTADPYVVDVAIDVAPTRAGRHEGLLWIRTNDPYTETVSVPIRLTATASDGPSVPDDPSVGDDVPVDCAGCATGRAPWAEWWLLLPLAWRRRRAV